MPIFLPVTPALKKKVLAFSRNSSGVQTISGVGFWPKVLILIASDIDATTEIWSHGFDDGVDVQCLYKAGDVAFVNLIGTYSINVVRDGSNYISGRVSSMNADGFSITWSVTGTVTAYVICLALG